MADDYTYIDLLITSDDITLDAGKNTEFVTDKNCIVQDIKHAIRESGLLVRMLGERDSIKRKRLMTEIEIVVEKDLRIKPGTASVNELGGDMESITIVADTLEFGSITI